MLTERRTGMPRTILMHLNIVVPDEDGRSTPQIVEAIEAAIEVGSDHDSVRGLEFVVHNLEIETVLAEVVD
jgi:hypothetical protein